jgi:type IV secretion system protein TrbL
MLMTRTLRAVSLTVLFLLAAAMFAPMASAAPSLRMEPKDPDPLSATYSPIAWATVWGAGAAGRDAVAKLEPQAAMEAVGFVSYAGHEQWQAMTPTDQTMLTTAWTTGRLLDKEFKRATKWSTDAFTRVGVHQPVPEWSTADADAVASDLGGKTYSSLTPGMKGVVQRIATIVTGDNKPTMPDDQWSGWMGAATKASFDKLAAVRFDWSKVSVTVGDPGAIVTGGCDAGLLNWACEATQAVVGGVTAAVDFVKDPLGWITQKAGDGATGVLSWISNTANASTQPDLSAAWWIDAYEKGMAVGIVLFGLILLYQFWEKVRGHIDAQEFLETFYIRVPGYFAGLVFGPPLAQFLLQGSSLLSDDIIKSWSGGSATDGINSIKAAVADAGQGKLLGGAFVALIFLILVILCGLLVFISLAVQAVTIYLSSAVFGIAFAWLVSARHKGGSFKIPFLFMGICFARPLLFFMLGIGEALVKKSITMSGDTLTQNLATIVMAVVVLSIAGFAPLLLLKFAPVSPAGMEGATGGATSQMLPGRQRDGGGSKLGQLAQRALPGGGGSSSPGGTGGSAGGAMQTALTAGGAAATAGGSSGGGGGGSLAGAASTPASATSRAGRGSGGSGSASTLTGQLLGRTRRHGGGTPSAGAARVAAARPPSSRTARVGKSVARGAGRASVAAAKAAPGVTAGAVQSARRVGHSAAESVGGDQQW